MSTLEIGKGGGAASAALTASNLAAAPFSPRTMHFFETKGMRPSRERFVEILNAPCWYSEGAVQISRDV